VDRAQRSRLRQISSNVDNWLSRRRVKVIVAMGILALMALGAFVWAGRLPITSQIGQLLYQVSADLVGTILALGVITPLLQAALREDVSLLDRLDLDSFVDEVRERGRETVSILDSFSMVLAPNQRYDLIYQGLRTSLGRGTEVRVLLLDPSSVAAERRHNQLAANFAQRGLPEPRQVMWQSVRQLRDFQEKLPSEWRERFEARFTPVQPVMHIYQCDKRAYISFPRGDRPSNFERQLEVDVIRADIWAMALDHFNELWIGATRLEQYIELPIRVILGDTEVSVRVEYVRHGGQFFVYNEMLVGRITQALLTRRIDQVHAVVEGDLDTRYAIGALYQHSDEAFQPVALGFLQKYGVERNVVLSMTPNAEADGSPLTVLLAPTAGITPDEPAAGNPVAPTAEPAS
jgi:hypothetical protein